MKKSRFPKRTTSQILKQLEAGTAAHDGPVAHPLQRTAALPVSGRRSVAAIPDGTIPLTFDFRAFRKNQRVAPAMITMGRVSWTHAP